MGAKSRYSLQRTMIIYFLLIGFASMLVGIEFLADFHGGDLKDEIWENINRTGGQPIDQKELFAPIDRMRSKAILMVGIIMVVMLIVLTMFIKHITEPLQHMIGLSEKISINEMASNLQEIILLSQGLCDNGQRYIDHALSQLNQKTPDARHLEKIHGSVQGLNAELDNLREFVACFKFYSVERHDAR